MPLTVWLTGIPGAGKTTIAVETQEALRAQGVPAVVLDGDLVRRGLSSDLGFSQEDRSENIRRVSEMARILNTQGFVVIAAFVSPMISQRNLAAHIIGDGFREVLVDCPLEVCESRDPKGLYHRARSGELTGLSGLDGPYEPPPAPHLILDTVQADLSTCVASVLNLLK